MERSGTKGWIAAAVAMLVVVFILALTLTMVLLDNDGRDNAEAGALEERLERLELQKNANDHTDDDHEEADKEDGEAKKDAGQDQNGGGNKNQGQQPVDNDKQVIEALGYNYASNERPDLNWQVTASSVNGDNAEVTVTATYAQGMETRTYDFKKQNGTWVFNGGSSGSAQTPPGP